MCEGVGLLKVSICQCLSLDWILEERTFVEGVDVTWVGGEMRSPKGRS